MTRPIAKSTRERACEHTLGHAREFSERLVRLPNGVERKSRRAYRSVLDLVTWQPGNGGGQRQSLQGVVEPHVTPSPTIASEG